jgi:mRNA-degrading endonuclease HigB of HigAB toxin-antitoxin module
MKLILSVILLFSLAFDQNKPTEVKLEGKYRMEYEANYVSENCTINIKGNKYSKKLNNGSKRKGTIEIVKQKFGNLYVLKEKDSELEVNIGGRIFRVSDTIFFRTKKINEVDKNSLTIYSGKLIKIK